MFDDLVRQADPSRYGKAAAEMRQKELLFQQQAEAAELEAGAADMECRAGVLALRSFKEQGEYRQSPTGLALVALRAGRLRLSTGAIVRASLWAARLCTIKAGCRTTPVRAWSVMQWGRADTAEAEQIET